MLRRRVDTFRPEDLPYVVWERGTGGADVVIARCRDKGPALAVAEHHNNRFAPGELRRLRGTELQRIVAGRRRNSIGGAYVMFQGRRVRRDGTLHEPAIDAPEFSLVPAG